MTRYHRVATVAAMFDVSTTAELLGVSPATFARWKAPVIAAEGFHVYAALGPGKRVLYVGLSRSVLYRIGQHYRFSPWAGEVKEWSIIPCADELEMTNFEGVLISHYRPVYNKTNPGALAAWTVPPLVGE